MNSKIIITSLFFLFFVLFLADDFEIITAAKEKVFKPKLSNIVKGKGWRVVNRNVSFGEENGKKAIRFGEGSGVGIVWLEDFEFQNGTIEFDVKGRNVLQKSFVGLAFQATDETNYDAIYFRPFNFKAEDPDRRSHAVQYIAAPDYGWKRLREESPGKYEQPIESPPDADEWFHARVVVKGKEVTVYVNNAEKPALTVEKLTASRSGKIGLWVGEQSDGDFANLRITKTAETRRK